MRKITPLPLNVLYIKSEKIYPAYVSKHNSDRDKQNNRLIIPNGKGWNSLALKKLSALLSRITSKRYSNLY